MKNYKKITFVLIASAVLSLAQLSAAYQCLCDETPIVTCAWYTKIANSFRAMMANRQAKKFIVHAEAMRDGKPDLSAWDRNTLLKTLRDLNQFMTTIRDQKIHARLKTIYTSFESKITECIRTFETATVVLSRWKSGDLTLESRYLGQLITIIENPEIKKQLEDIRARLETENSKRLKITGAMERITGSHSTYLSDMEWELRNKTSTEMKSVATQLSALIDGADDEQKQLLKKLIVFCTRFCAP